MTRSPSVREAVTQLSPGVHFLGPTIPIHVLQGHRRGHTVVIQAGIHGDEIAGVHALQEMLEDGLHPKKGRLIAIPIMNPAAYRARERTRPGGLDLNRCFPGDASSQEVEPRMAAAFMRLIRHEQPALVATLHESRTCYSPDVNPSFGQTLVYGVDPCPDVLVNAVEQLNTRLDVDAERWATHYFPVSTSSTEVIVDAVGCVGTCVETWMGFEERRRVEMHKDVVHTLLKSYEIL